MLAFSACEGWWFACVLVGCSRRASCTSEPGPAKSPSGVSTAFDAHPPLDSSSAPRDSVTGTLELIGPQPASSTQLLSVRATVNNHAHQSLLLPVVALSLGQLSRDIVDANGTRIPTLPPPVPLPNEGRREPLESGESRTIELNLNVFSLTLTTGRYVVTWGARDGTVGATTAYVIGP